VAKKKKPSRLPLRLPLRPLLLLLKPPSLLKLLRLRLLLRLLLPKLPSLLKLLRLPRLLPRQSNSRSAKYEKAGLRAGFFSPIFCGLYSPYQASSRQLKPAS
jgi:hypothetical protein